MRNTLLRTGSHEVEGSNPSRSTKSLSSPVYRLPHAQPDAAGADSAAFCDTGSEAALSCAGRGHAKCEFKAKRIVFKIKGGHASFVSWIIFEVAGALSLDLP